MSGRRLLAVALAAAVATPALAYVPTVGAILRRAAEKRGSLTLTALEASGTLEVQGEAGARLAEAMGLPPSSDGRLAVPARFLVKIPGRCRLELARPGLADADRPFVVVRDGRVTGRVLDTIPAAVALARGACALVAVRGGPNDDRAYAAALTRRGVPLDASSLGRVDGRVAFVIGGTGADGRPSAAFDKETAQPLRLLAKEGSVLLDTRLAGWGSSEGGDWFPRSVEVYEAEELRARFATTRASANPKLPDAMF
jgi:hypothetical protein